jgi:hypothetical protein
MGISSFLIDIRYLAIVACTYLVGYVVVIGIPCTPLVTIVKNYGIGHSQIGMPLLFNIVVFNIVLLFNPNIDFVILKVANLALLKVG